MSLLQSLGGNAETAASETEVLQSGALCRQKSGSGENNDTKTKRIVPFEAMNVFKSSFPLYISGTVGGSNFCCDLIGAATMRIQGNSARMLQTNYLIYFDHVKSSLGTNVAT